MLYYVLEHNKNPGTYVVQGAEGFVPENHLGLAPEIDGEPVIRGELIRIQNGVPVVDMAAKAAYDSARQAAQDALDQRLAKINQIKTALALVDDISNLQEAKAFLKKLVKYIGLMDVDA